VLSRLSTISLSPCLSCCCSRFPPLPPSSPSSSSPPFHRPSSATACSLLVASGDLRFPDSPDISFRQCLALGMAKHNPSTPPRPSSIRFLRNLSAISRSPTPSSALLTLLASLVGSVNSFPVACPDSNESPPSFLCPSLEPRSQFGVQELVLPPQTPPTSPSVPGPSRIIPTNAPTPTVRRRVRRNLAPGYTQGDDGRWRKLSTWSLYGSSICVVRVISFFSLCPNSAL